MWRSLSGIGLVGLTFYLSACLFLFFQQTNFIYFPSPVIETTPDAFNVDYQDVWLSVAASNGKVERIHGWWIPAKPNAKVLLYLHGNGINIGANVGRAYKFHQLGFSVLLIDYRGYGRSEGTPTESRVYEDAAAAWDYLVKQGHHPSEIFIYGHSLGGAIAINLALQHPDAAGLIVESSFTSIEDIANLQGMFWMFPIHLILNQRFDSISKVGALQVPVLFIHGEADFQVPASMSQQLYASAPKPKYLFLVPEAGHNNVAEIAGFQYLQAVKDFVEQVRSRQTQLLP